MVFGVGGIKLDHGGVFFLFLGRLFDEYRSGLWYREKLG